MLHVQKLLLVTWLMFMETHLNQNLCSAFCRDELFASLFGKKPEYKIVEREEEEEEVSDVVILR